MRIGVLDTDGEFCADYFTDKKLKIVRMHGKEKFEKNAGFSHAEYVCAHIFKENPQAEIILVPIIKSNMKCSVADLISGIEMLIRLKVDMINISAGDEYRYHSELENVCKEAYRKGIYIVAAYSNRSTEATYPASFPFVYGVGVNGEKEPGKILWIDTDNRNIFFSSSYFSIYHLGIPKMHCGNSFACAKATGILSCVETEGQEFLKGLLGSIFNKYYPYQSLKTKSCYFLSNRLEEHLEQRFIKEVVNAVAAENFRPEILGMWKQGKQIEGFDTIFVDHDSYSDILYYKQDILECIRNNPQIEWVFRYPLYNLSERVRFYKNHKVAIYQFFI